jgi:hypothetical protein
LTYFLGARKEEMQRKATRRRIVAVERSQQKGILPNQEVRTYIRLTMVNGIGDVVAIYRRINNLVYAKHLLSQALEATIKAKANERGGLPRDTSSETKLSWRNIFDRGHIALNRALVRVISYAAKRLVFIDLKQDFIDGLYANATNLGICSIHSLVPILNGIRDDIFNHVVADEVLRASGKLKSEAAEEDSTAQQLWLAFFKHFLDAFESIVIMDPHAGRKFEAKDTDIILDDIHVSIWV